MQTVCFTGHRDVIVTQKLKMRLWAEMQQLVKNGVVDFFVGGALGFDMLAEKKVITLREQYPQVKLHLVLPCSK